MAWLDKVREKYPDKYEKVASRIEELGLIVDEQTFIGFVLDEGMRELLGKGVFSLDDDFEALRRLDYDELKELAEAFLAGDFDRAAKLLGLPS